MFLASVIFMKTGKEKRRSGCFAFFHQMFPFLPETLTGGAAAVNARPETYLPRPGSQTSAHRGLVLIVEKTITPATLVECKKSHDRHN
jgi:hypothetical protein